MKTKELIEYLRCCYKGKCDKCTMKMKSDCINDLLFAAAEKLSKNEVEINNQRCEIEALKKELAEREAAPVWISVEERLPKYVGHYFSFNGNETSICFFSPDETFSTDGVTHWMPIPKPPEHPKKVKTYKDVFVERIQKEFPDLEIGSMKPPYCRAAVFAEEFECEGLFRGGCEECWNQPYKEEGGAE